MKRAACFGVAMALAAVLAGPAWARIGVTSVTDGTTSVAQGTDLQVGQRITTGTDGRVHLMFVDGSAVTVGPNSVVSIENYAYDPASKKGALALHVKQGTVRFVGGAISKTADAQIRTPSSTIGIRGGIAAVTVSNGGATTANFLHGSAMRVSGQGITQTAKRSGSQINVSAGGHPGQPTVLAAGQLTAIQSLDRAPSGAAQGSPTVRMAAPAVDTKLANSGLGKHNPDAVQSQSRSPSVPATIVQGPTQAVQASQQQFGLQQLVGLQTVTLPVPPAAVRAPTSTPMTASIPAPSSPMPAAKPAVPVVPAAKPPVVFHYSGSGSTMAIPSFCCGTIFTSGSGSTGAPTVTGTNQYSGSITTTGTK